MTARVANSLRLGKDGKFFLIGASLYTHGNVWRIADPPEDWKDAEKTTPAPRSAGSGGTAPTLRVNKKSWPYNLAAESGESHVGRK